jgi:hypothetical protein
VKYPLHCCRGFAHSRTECTRLRQVLRWLLPSRVRYHRASHVRETARVGDSGHQRAQNAYAVTFLPTALRGGTRTLFSSQGTTNLFFLKGQNMVVMDKGSSQTPLITAVETARLAGAQAPFVRFLNREILFSSFSSTQGRDEGARTRKESTEMLCEILPLRVC